MSHSIFACHARTIRTSSGSRASQVSPMVMAFDDILATDIAAYVAAAAKLDATPEVAKQAELVKQV